MFRTIDYLKDVGLTKPSHISDLFKVYGINPPSLMAIDKWLRRGNIPGEWFPVLMALIEAEIPKRPALMDYLAP